MALSARLSTIDGHMHDFPIFKTKVDGVTRRFELTDPAERKEYFIQKAGPEIEKIRQYLKEKTFVAYLLGKKNSGKGTYSKLFVEAIGSDRIGHVSVGDLVRDTHAALTDPAERERLITFLKKQYRGFHSIEEILDLIEGRSQSTLVSTDLILALLKYDISRRPRQVLFIDGFPRGLDQVPHAMRLKDLLGYHEDQDFFVFISLPNTVIDERIKYRVICPKCKTPRNLKLLATKEAGYDETKGEYFLKCDNPDCGLERMVTKEGDELGIEPIRARLETDEEIFEHLLGLKGIPQVLLRNAIPIEKGDLVDEYELTPAYEYERDATGTVTVIEKPLVMKDDHGQDCYSLLPAAVTIAMIKQIAAILEGE